MHAFDVLRDPECCGDVPKLCPQPAKGERGERGA